MTITSENKRNQYTITAAQVIFPYTFRILDQEHLLVIHTTVAGVETELEITTNYTVSGVGDAGGGNVTTCGDDSPYPTGDAITIIRDMPLTQLTDYVEHDTFPAESHEDALDKLTMVIQEIAEKWDRMLILAKSSAYSDLTLPDPVASKLLAWKDDLSGIKNVGIESEGDLAITDYIETLLDDEDATAALATLGLTVTAFVKTLLDDVSASAVLTTLGVSTFIKTLLNDADVGTAQSTLGISAFIKTLLDDADAAAARATLGTLCQIKTGTYTGDGTTGQAITGVGFRPKYVKIWLHPTAEAEARMYEKLDQTWGDYSVDQTIAAAAEHWVHDSGINSLDADGFTVDDDETDGHPNTNEQVYDYLALG